MILIHRDMAFGRGKGQAGAEFLRRNNVLDRFELLMHPSQNTRPAQRTSSWADVHDQYNFVEVKSFKVYPS